MMYRPPTTEMGVREDVSSLLLVRRPSLLSCCPETSHGERDQGHRGCSRWPNGGLHTAEAAPLPQSAAELIVLSSTGKEDRHSCCMENGRRHHRLTRLILDGEKEAATGARHLHHRYVDRRRSAIKVRVIRSYLVREKKGFADLKSQELVLHDPENNQPLQQITELVGKTLLFQITTKSDHTAYRNTPFPVLRINNDPQILKEHCSQLLKLEDNVSSKLEDWRKNTMDMLKIASKELAATTSVQRTKGRGPLNDVTNVRPSKAQCTTKFDKKSVMCYNDLQKAIPFGATSSTANGQSLSNLSTVMGTTNHQVSQSSRSNIAVDFSRNLEAEFATVQGSGETNDFSRNLEAELETNSAIQSSQKITFEAPVVRDLQELVANIDTVKVDNVPQPPGKKIIINL
nr:hypothetical protein Iba_chr14eCG5870 [Ipomoea batatas]